MTANQLEYWKQVETQRHNKALEEQGLVGLQIQQNQLKINQAAQAENERTNRAKELETYRSHLANESNELVRLQEQQRTNLANEAIRRSELAEQRRHNEQTEYLTSVSDPFRAIATTVDKLFGDNNSPGSKLGASLIDDVSKLGSSIGSALSEAALVANQKMTGTYAPRVSGVHNNGVKQLPNLSAMMKPTTIAQVTKTPTKFTYTPTTTTKTASKQTTVNGNNLKKSQPVRLLGSKSR